MSAKAEGGSYRLVAIDLDGTLLGSQKHVSTANRRAVWELREAGIHVALVSGRRFTGLLPFLDELPEDVLVVANSGAIVKESRTGRILRRRLLPLAIAREILRLGEDSGMEPILHDGPDAEGFVVLRLSARDLPTMKRYLGETHPPPSWVECLTVERDPVQIGFTGGVEDIRAFETTLSSFRRAEPGFATARTEYPREDLALLDVLEQGATKARALEFLAEHLGIVLAETMAIGDNWNDLDMLEHAGLGVVMGNASVELRARGFPSTKSNDEDGVAEAIRRYVFG